LLEKVFEFKCLGNDSEREVAEREDVAAGQQ
jgi:hypothetical protein